MSDDRPSENWLKKLTNLFSTEADHLIQLADLLKKSKEQNLIDADALFMIEGVLGVSEMRARDAMVPRGKMVCVENTDSLEDILEQMLDTAHSRYPVISSDGEEAVEVKGVLLAKDVLRAVVTHELDTKEALEALYRPPIVVPESKRLNVLLREFKAGKNHMAFVVDEYGELAGLITIEDVLEEIVGEIADEHDEEETENIHRHVQGGYSVEAVTPTEEFNTFFKVQLESDKVETIGGVVSTFLGRIPEVNEVFDMQGLTFKVLKADERHVECFKINSIAPGSAKSEQPFNSDEDVLD